MKIITLVAEGMHCKSCEVLIVDNLKESPGINSAAACHKEGLVCVEYDETRNSPEKIKDIIRKQGFKVDDKDGRKSQD